MRLTARDALVQRNLDKSPRGLYQTRMMFYQKPNDMQKEVVRCLAHFKFKFNISSTEDCHSTDISGRNEIMRFLGSIRPHRLLTKFNANRLGQMPSTTVKLVDKTYVGERRAVALKTSSGTFLAEGLTARC